MPANTPTPGSASPAAWECRGRVLDLSRRIHIMGIVNTTPDSFSDGGRLPTVDAAIDHALRMEQEGVDILDIGGESTRPGAAPVGAEEELARMLPVVHGLAGRTSCLISVDTRKAYVARACLDAGAHILNDVTALQGDPEMAALAAESGAGVVLMHMRGDPSNMQDAPHYNDVELEVGDFLAAAEAAAVHAGVAPGRIVLDPGIGFGKTLDHNLALLAASGHLQTRLGRPLLLGLSRKRFIGTLTGRAVGERLPGSLAALAASAMLGVRIFRVHDAKESCDAARIVERMTIHHLP